MRRAGGFFLSAFANTCAPAFATMHAAKHASVRESGAVCTNQRWSRGHNARGQGPQKNPRPRPKTPKKSEAKAKDSISENRHSRGQGQECSRPRTKDTCASALQKKKGLPKNFSSDLHKKRFPKNFSSAPQNFNNSKNSAVLEPRTSQFSRT